MPSNSNRTSEGAKNSAFCENEPKPEVQGCVGTVTNSRLHAVPISDAEVRMNTGSTGFAEDKFGAHDLAA